MSRPETPLATYLREIARTPLLTRDEERALAVRVQQGDTGARDHLIRANLRLVVKIARSQMNKGIPLEDLIQEGNTGLMHAVGKFDPARDCRLTTYASHWIRQRIGKAMEERYRTVHIPVYVQKLVRLAYRASNFLREVLGRDLSRDELEQCNAAFAQRQQLSRKQITGMLEGLRLGECTVENNTEALELIPERCIPVDTGFRAAELARALNVLKERELVLIRLRYGLDDGDPRTLAQIGAVLGLTRERVRQIQITALRKLKKRFGIILPPRIRIRKPAGHAKAKSQTPQPGSPGRPHDPQPDAA